MPDSDGDGISDGEELAGGSDPTLFDTRPPDIEVRYAAFATTAWPPYTEYRLIFVAEDASGVKRTQVVQEGEVRTSADWSAGDLPRRVQRDASFRTGGLESSIDALTGTTVDVTATDVHDNTGRVTGLERAHFYGRVAGELGAEVESPVVAESLGKVSGFAASLGASADAIKQFAEDPFGFIDGLRALVGLLQDLGLLDELVRALAQDVADKQDRDNPYPEGTALHETFETNWYTGYVVGFVAKAAVGASATKAVKSTKTFQRVADYLASSRAGRTFGAVKSPVDRGKARVAARIVAGADRTSAPVLSRAKSAGAAYRLWRLQRRVDACSGVSVASTGCGDLFDGLDADEQAVVSEALQRDGVDGARLAARLEDPSEKQALARFVADGDVREGVVDRRAVDLLTRKGPE